MKRTRMLRRLLPLTALLTLLAILLSSCFLVMPSGTNGKNTEEKPTAERDSEKTSSVCEHEYESRGYIGVYACTEGGKERLVCTKCGTGFERSVEPKEHTLVTAHISATCTTSGYYGGMQCSECKAWVEKGTATGPLAHDYQGGICLLCGKAESSSDDAPITEYHSTYGYEYLGTMANGAAYHWLYGEIDRVAASFHNDPLQSLTSEVLCILSYSDRGMTTDEAMAVWKTYRDDHPLYYWLSNRVQYNENELYVLVDPAYLDGETRLAENRSIYASIQAYQSGLWIEGADYAEYNNAVFLHDAIIQAIDYAYDAQGNPESADWAHSIVGVFSGRGAVCEGFAKAYQLLLNLNGIECIYVTGQSQGEKHAWNIVQLNGAWYGVDITWDDNNEDHSPYHYFLLSEREFNKTHEKDLPTNTGLAFLYATPTLAEYNVEPVALYKNNTLLGWCLSPNEALAAITDANADYIMMLLALESDFYHTPESFHLYDFSELPQMRSLTVVGNHTVTGFRYTATSFKLDTDLIADCPLTLKSLFLSAESGTVRLYCDDVRYDTDQTQYYSSIDPSVQVFPRENAA